MPTTFQAVREILIQVGKEGISQSDLYKQIRTREDIPRRGGDYNTFRSAFWYLVLMKWVEPTGQSLPAFNRSGEESLFLSPRILYRITKLGLSVEESLWLNPRTSIYPVERGLWRKYYTPTGRGRGRPRKERRRRGRRPGPQPRLEPQPEPEEERVQLPPQPEPEPIPPEPVLLEPPRERRRRIRISPYVRMQASLRNLDEKVLSIVENPSTAVGVQEELVEVLDDAVEAAEKAKGFEKQALEALVDKIVDALNGFTKIRRGIGTGNVRLVEQGVAEVRNATRA